MHALVLVEEDEGEEGLQQSRLGHAPQEEVEVRRGGHHLLQGELHKEEGGQSGWSQCGAGFGPITAQHINSGLCLSDYSPLALKPSKNLDESLMWKIFCEVLGNVIINRMDREVETLN